MNNLVIVDNAWGGLYMHEFREDGHYAMAPILGYIGSEMGGYCSAGITIKGNVYGVGLFSNKLGAFHTISELWKAINE